MGFFDDLDKSKAAKSRPSEITGHQHMFHSFPKEFQVWHNTQYVMEKKATLDKSLIPSGLLNSYMWTTFGDGSAFGLATGLNVFIPVFILKFFPNFWGLLLAIAAFLPWVLYAAFHFIFYAKIRAQIIGEITKDCADYIAKPFYQSFIAVSVSLVLAGSFMFSILDSIGELTSALYYKSEGKILVAQSITPALREGLKNITNLIADMTTYPPGFFNKILFNHFITISLFALATYYIIKYFDTKGYNERRKEVDEEMTIEEFGTGYPIEKALYILHKWRKENAW